MTFGGALLVLSLLTVGGLVSATLAVVVRGGRGAGDPPASRPHVDPAGFPVLSSPRGVFERRHSGRTPSAAPPARPTAGSWSSSRGRTAEVAPTRPG